MSPGRHATTVPQPDGDDALALPERIGRYRIRGELGRGGVGRVLAADDDQLGRPVALKLLQAPPGSDAEAVARLLREARLAGGLSHPGIVRVHEVGAARVAGVDGPLHYIVMERVDGGSLRDRLPELSQARRIAVLEDVARAVGFAHAAGVIHRDLKPANVLLDVEGRAVVTDFGLALAAVDATRLTDSGQQMGTVGYMAPEQVLGQRDRMGPPTDVWALGVMLFELLCDRRPFDRATGPSVLHAIVEDDPPALRRLATGVAPGLEAICSRALAKEPAARYADANALADDLGRWREGRALRAGSTTGVGRALRRLVRRRSGKLAVGVAALALALPVAGWQLSRVRRQRAFVRLQTAAQRAAAEGRWPDALSASRRALDLHPDPALEALIARGRAVQAAAQAALATRRESERARAGWRARVGAAAAEVDRLIALTYQSGPLARAPFEALETRLTQLGRGTLSDASLDAERQRVMGRGYGLCGRPRRAVASLTRAAELAPEDGAVHRDLGRLYLERALVAMVLAGRTTWDGDAARWRALAERHLARATTRWDGARPIDGRLLGAYRAALTRDPAAVQRVCGEALADHADSLGSERLWVLLATALTSDSEALAAFDQALARRPHDSWARYLRASRRARAGQLDGARADLEAALALHPRLAPAQVDLGNVLRMAGDRAGALAAFEKALAIDDRLAAAHHGRGITLHDLNRAADAVAAYTRALALDPTLPQTRRYRAQALARLGRHREALEDYRRALEQTPDDARLLTLRALSWVAAGRLQRAEADLQRARRRAPADPEPPCQLGILRLRQGDTPGAERWFGQCVAIRPRHPRVHYYRGLARLTRRDWRGALACFSQQIAIDPRGTRALIKRADVLIELDRYPEAIADLDQALALKLGPPADLRLSRGIALMLGGQLAAAIAEFRALVAARPTMWQAWANLGMALASTGDRAAAIEALQRARALAPPAAQPPLDARLRRVRGG